MSKVLKKQVIVGAVLIAIFVSIPITVSFLSQRQEQQSHAAASTTLTFTPTSSTTTPIQAKVGDTINLDLFVNPGSNQVTFVKYQVTYDPTKVQLVSSNPVNLNSTIFTSVEGPVVTSGTIAQSVSIGSDPTKVITTNTKVGTLHFTAIGGTNGGTTPITFGTISEALSSGPNEQASQDVLSSTTPAVITISGGNAPSPSPSPLPTVTGTALGFTVLLDGVGAAGDNPNPTGNSLSNKNPLHPQRKLSIQVFDTSNNLVASTSAPIAYNSTAGNFTGQAALPSSVTSGSYYVKIQADRYLRKLVPGIAQVTTNKLTQLPSVRLVSGDTNTDNVLNVLDYNALLDCGYGEINPSPIADQASLFNSQECQVHQPAQDVDLNDDGIVNSTDYNLFLRELSVQNGD